MHKKMIPYLVSGVSGALAIQMSMSAAPVEWSVNNHYYEFVRSSVTWSEAKAAAALLRYTDEASGTELLGHLATISSSEENAFILENFGSATANEFAWAAGIEPGDDGVWKWGAGPEAGDIFDDRRDGDVEGYANWGGIEPNDDKAGEDYLMFNIGNALGGIASGQWADAAETPSTEDPVVGYIVEYSRPYPCPLIPLTRPSEIELRWMSDTGDSYAVEYSSDPTFSDGVAISGSSIGTGDFLKLELSIPAPSLTMFFRLVASGSGTVPKLFIRPSEVELIWRSLPGKIYQIESYDSGLATWTAQGSSITATAWTTTTRFKLEIGASRKIYRVACP